LKSTMSELSQKLTIPHDVLLRPALVKSLAAQSGVDVGDFLAEAGARPWQIELSAPVLTDALARLPRTRPATRRPVRLRRLRASTDRVAPLIGRSRPPARITRLGGCLPRPGGPPRRAGHG